jgi:hypothetical protein
MNDWINVSQLYNWANRDQLLDWFNMCGTDKRHAKDEPVSNYVGSPTSASSSDTKQGSLRTASSN